MLCSQVGDSKTFRVKSLKGRHRCGGVFSNKNANTNWVAKVVVDKFRNAANLTVTEIIDDVRKQYSAGITEWRAFKAKQMALALIEGDGSKQYTQLWSYSAELRRVSAGNTCKIQLERPGPDLPPRFGSYYMCLDGCKRAFLAGCRPFIGVDGCHLKTKYKGQLLIAVGRDPNDQYFPLAFAVVETETKESWRWFLTLLLEDIGDITTHRWVFISDQQKGLIPVFEEMLQGVEHRFCLRHLYSNFKKKFGGGTMIRDLMMGAAKATYYELWEEKMNQIKQLDNKAYDWLRAIPTKCWCKHAFSYYPKCDVLMNNLSESFNSTILLAREKPIITMFEWIRTYLMGRFATLKEKLGRYRGNVMPKPRKRLDREIEKSGFWLATWAGELKFEVTHTMGRDRFVVNLQSRSCSCNFWELVGIPCRHVVAAITYKGEDPELYVHGYYMREAYELCYNHTIAPINGERLWPKTEDELILPPEFKAGPGRPKKLRRREADEEPDPTRLKKKHCVNKCSRCHQQGHNTRKCPLPPPEVNDGENQVNSNEGTAEGSQTHEGPAEGSQTQSQQVPNRRGRPKPRMGVEVAASEAHVSQVMEGNVQNQAVPRQRGRPKKPTTGNVQNQAGPSSVQQQKKQQRAKLPIIKGPKSQVQGEQIQQVPTQTPSFAQNLTVAQLLGKMIHVNNLWEHANKSVQEFHSQNANTSTNIEHGSPSQVSNNPPSVDAATLVIHSTQTSQTERHGRNDAVARNSGKETRSANEENGHDATQPGI